MVKTQLEQVFNHNDVRGIYGETLNDKVIEAISRAALEILVIREDYDAVIIGRDGRNSSLAINEIVKNTALDLGIGVIDISENPTEVSYFGSIFYGLPAIIITASHNPSEWNGFKFSQPYAAPVGKNGLLDEIKQRATEIVTAGEPLQPSPEKGVYADQPELVNTYIRTLYKLVPLTDEDKELSIVVDCANGVGANLYPLMLNGENTVFIGDEIDGNFPSHEPNPLKTKNLKALIEKVKDHEADIGIALDGDADRVVFVFPDGTVMAPSRAQGYIASLALKKFSYAGNKVLYSEVSSQSVKEAVEAVGGEAISTPVGHSAIKKLMAETKAVVGVEHSGHYYFTSLHGADSAALATLLVIEDLVQYKRENPEKTLADRVNNIPKWVSAEEQNWLIDDREGAVDQVTKNLDFETEELLGGGRRFNGDGWSATLRPSNSEPCLRLNIEATEEQLLASKEHILVTALSDIGAKLEEGTEHE